MIILLAVREAVYENKWCDLSAPFRPFETELCFVGNILLRDHRIVIPEALRVRILKLAHEGHPGINKMKRRLRAKVWWPKMDQDTTEFVKKCEGCILTGACAQPEPLRPTELPTSPWQHIAMDFHGPLPSGHELLMVVDYYSRYIEVEPMKKTDATATIKVLQRMFARFGLPESIKADNGPPFNSQTFQWYCDTNQIQLRNTTPYSPELNGLIERQNESILKCLQICQSQKGDWQEELQKYLLMYRSSPHSLLLKSPAELMFNRKIRDKLPQIKHSLEEDDESYVKEELRDVDKINKLKMKDYADKKRRAKISEIKEGDTVILKRQVKNNKLCTTFEPTPYKVIQRKGTEITVENEHTKKRYRRNVTHAKKFHGTDLILPSVPDNENLLDGKKQNGHQQPRPHPEHQLPCQHEQQLSDPDQAEPEHEQTLTEQDQTHPPPKRIRRTPARYDIFEPY